MPHRKTLIPERTLAQMLLTRQTMVASAMVRSMTPTARLTIQQMTDSVRQTARIWTRLPLRQTTSVASKMRAIPTGDVVDEEEDIFGGDDFGGADDFGAGDDTGAADDGFDDVLDGDDFGGDDADLDAIFDDGAKIERVRDGFREVIPVAARRSTDLPYRLWTDNTGEYRTVGRLVQITKTHVRMLKDNGKHSTVAKTRLSKADLKYAAEMESVLGLRDNFDAIALR